MRTFTKDPDSVLSYGFDWSEWLQEGETISSSTWVLPTGLASEHEEATGNKTLVWLSGGVAGETYVVTNRIETTGLGHPHIKDVSFRLKVREQ